MATNFPTSLDTFTTPSGSSTLGGSTPTHTGLHTNEGDAIEALEAKVGVNGSAVTTSLDYKVTTLETSYNVTGAAAGTDVITTQVTADTQKRMIVNADGSHEWGSGSAVADTTLSRASTSQLRITPSANASSSTSVGGALNVTNSSSTGAGLVVYSTQASPAGHLLVSRVNNASFNQAAIYSEYTGTSHAVTINHQGTGTASSALNVASTNTSHSAIGVSGVETDRGTIKVTHTGTGADTAASALSIDLAGAGTASQGIFVTSTGGGTSGNLMEVRNGGTGALFNVSSTGVVGLGSGTGAPDTNLYRSAANTLKTDDALVVAGAATLQSTLSVTSTTALGGAATSTGSAATSVAYAATVTADTFDRFRILADGDMEWGSGAAARDVTLYRSAADILATDDDFAIKTAGKGLQVAEGANAKMGTATLVGGTVTVSTTAVTANSRIFLTSQSDGGTPGFLRITARTAATSFTITSSSGTDTSTVAWMLVEPA